MTHLDLFSGIGGLALAAEAVWPDIEHIFCEIDPFCQAVLKKHWPTSKIYGDIRKLNIGLENGTIGLCNGNAHNAKNDPSQAEDRIANRATRDELLNGANATEHTTKNDIRTLTNADSLGPAARRFDGDLESAKQEMVGKRCQSALSIKNPDPQYEDIRTFTNTKSEQTYNTESNRFHPEFSIQNSRIDLLTGGFPCQPFSQAGKRRGTKDDRFLWGEMLRTIQIIRPHYVVAENVRGLLSIDGGVVFEQVCLDLETLGYEVQPFIIPACAVNAPHRRDRVWIIANAKHKSTRDAQRRGNEKGTSARIAGSDQDAADADRTGLERRESEARTGQRGLRNRVRYAKINQAWNEDWPQVAARFCTLDDGLRSDVVRSAGSRDAPKIPRPRGWRNAALKAAGNAIVPQVAEQIMRAIKSMEDAL